MSKAVSLRKRKNDDGPNHRQDGQPLRKVYPDAYLPICHGDFFCERVLVKAASLMTTDPTGKEDCRTHLSHGFISCPVAAWDREGASKGNCQQFLNPLDRKRCSEPLFTSWIVGHSRNASTSESDSEASDGTLVKPDQTSTGFPPYGRLLHGVQTNAVFAEPTAEVLHHGNSAITRCIHATLQDNPANGPITRALCPRRMRMAMTSRNSSAGGPQVPLATYTVGAPRSAAKNDDGCEGSGPILPFPENQSGPLASGDPRLSIEEALRKHGRPTHPCCTNAVENLVRSGYVPFDAQRALSRI